METNPEPANILLVDDDPNSLRALQELLERAGHSLVLARSGTDALRCVLQQNFAAILMDVRMPGMDGFETAKIIRERDSSRHTPILFLTSAYEDLPSMFRGYEAGAVDYIFKPLVPEVLESKIAVFVDLHNYNVMLTKEIDERKRIEERLKASEKSLRALSKHLLSVREEESKRIAREIHDELGQALTGIKINLTWVASRLSPEQKALTLKAKSIFRLIDSTLQSVRKIAARLRPEILDQLGLIAAIKWQTRDFQKSTGIRCKIVMAAETAEFVDSNPEFSTATFRIFQELLTNVARHANATRIDIQMQLENQVFLLEVRDNGIGIPRDAILNSKSLGLMGMRERALTFGGKIEFVGAQDSGTQVIVSIPYPDPET